MTFKILKNYISKNMKMSHIYQPLMLKVILVNNGKASTKEIAKEFLKYDPWSLKYYEDITKTMPGKVLTKNLEIINKDKNNYSIKSFQKLTHNEKKVIINLCNEKIKKFIEIRGDQPWKHRSKSSGLISGSIRWQVLERSKGRCESCGVSNDKKALEIDHIKPRSNGGSDDLHNLQALCYSCNSMKRNKSNTDFRLVKESYNKRDKNCLFCKIKKRSIVFENELAYATFDSYPVTKFHCLIIPKRHVKDYFGLYQPEINACNSLISLVRETIFKKDKKVKAFNIGINAGKLAGQTIMHCHIHLIPRREGDVENPQGGVRGVIPSKQHYIRKSK